MLYICKKAQYIDKNIFHVELIMVMSFKWLYFGLHLSKFYFRYISFGIL